jgi:hypothetical protein
MSNNPHLDENDEELPKYRIQSETCPVLGTRFYPQELGNWIGGDSTTYMSMEDSRDTWVHFATYAEAKAFLDEEPEPFPRVKFTYKYYRLEDGAETDENGDLLDY